MYDYREYCPIAKAAQILGERWTLLIVRELLMGSTRFNQLRRYLPRISPSLLKTRLRALEDEGIVARVKTRDRDGYEYVLTPSGKGLEAVLLSLGQWATQWQYDKFKNDEIFVEGLMRDIEHVLVPAEMPGERTVLKFLFDGVEDSNQWYIVVDGEHVEACDVDRALDVDVYLSCTPRDISEVLLGKLPLGAAIADGRLRVTGSLPHARCIDRWLGPGPYVKAARMGPLQADDGRHHR